jgi:hypothetical protein
MAGSFFSLNELIKELLEARSLLAPLTEFVGSLNQPLTFIASFVVMLALLIATGMLSKRGLADSLQPIAPKRAAQLKQ